MAKSRKKQTIRVDVSEIKTRNQWPVKPFTRIEKPKTAYSRLGKERTPYEERRNRGDFYD